MLYQGNHYQALDNNGKPLSGGKLKFFEPSTSTPKNVYSDAELTTSAGSEVTLDSAGRATVFLDGEYQVREEDSNGVEIQTTDGVNRQEVETSEGINNPSFETEGTSSTDIPGWTLFAPSGVTIERVTTDSYHGEACLEITSDGTDSGLAVTEDFIPVSPGREYEVSFALESSSATVRNIIVVRWYDDSQSLVSTTTVYDESSGNPTSWETKVRTATPPASARYAKAVVQLGITAGKTRYDDVGLDFLQTSGDFISNEGTTLPSILSGTKANRPSAGTEGRWYYATDESRRYRDTGSVWETKGGHLERVLVTMPGVRTIPDATNTEIAFDSEIYDVGDWWSSGTDITVPRNGFVIIQSNVTWAANATGERELFHRIANVFDGHFGFSSVPATASGSVAQFVASAPVAVTAGDIISVVVTQTSGGDLDLVSADTAVYYIE